MRRFKLVNVTIPDNLKDPEWGLMGEDIFKRTYSRSKIDGDSETWAETVKRVVDGNCNFVEQKYIEGKEPEKLFDLLYNFKILPGGRHLWVTGIEGSQFISNCWTSGWDKNDFSRHFTFAFARLMEGGGVGANYSNSYFKGFKTIPNKVSLHIVCDETHNDYLGFSDLLSDQYSNMWHGAHPIQDSREGWVESLSILLNAHYNDSEDIILDVSQIRPSGTRLKSFGGTASGPKPLIEMMHEINRLMNEAVGTKPNSKLCLLIDHEIAKTVVAGNVRRSARMSMKHWKDDDIFEFIQMKEDSLSHWTTNISVIIDNAFFSAIRKKDKTARKVLRAISEGMLKNGEPGLFNITKANEGELYDTYCSNPCGEITLPEYGSCNLGSVNISKYAHKETEMREAFRLMARFLIRATYSDYPDAEAKRIVERDRRIGVGITGFADWQVLEGHTYSHFPNCDGQKQKLKNMAEEVREEARNYAFQLRIPEPVKVTMVAPTGTTSKLCGSSEGIQPILFKYFKRRVSFSTIDSIQKTLLDRLEKEGHEIEDSVYVPNTKCVIYYCKASILDSDVDRELVESADDLTVEDMLSVQKTIQQIYADNSVSFTLNVDTEEISVKNLERTIIAFGPDIKGTTVMPKISNRQQMPYEKITEEEYNNAKIKSIGVGESECKNGVCSLVVKNEDDE